VGGEYGAGLHPPLGPDLYPYLHGMFFLTTFFFFGGGGGGGGVVVV